MATYSFEAEPANTSKRSELSTVVYKAGAIRKLIGGQQHQVHYNENAFGTLQIADMSSHESATLIKAMTIDPSGYTTTSDNPLNRFGSKAILAVMRSRHPSGHRLPIQFDASLNRHGSIQLDNKFKLGPNSYLPTYNFTSLAGNLALARYVTLQDLAQAKTPQAREELDLAAVTAEQMYSEVVRLIHPALTAVHGLTLASLQQKIDAHVQT